MRVIGDELHDALMCTLMGRRALLLSEVRDLSTQIAALSNAAEAGATRPPGAAPESDADAPPVVPPPPDDAPPPLLVRLPQADDLQEDDTA